MVEDAYIQPAQQVARVTYVAPDRSFARAQLLDRSLVDIGFPGQPTGLRVGDVIFVDREGATVESAPRELWRDERWVGVVRLVKGDSVVVTDASGHLRRLPAHPEPPVEAGNTVECEGEHIVDVLAERPLRTIDLREEDELDISAFQPPIDDSLTFASFGGLDQAVARAKELVEVPFGRREALDEINAPPIKGVLFTGPPGTGKTLLARIIARESGAKLFAVSGPTIFSKWYGESQGILRRIFAAAEAAAPSIIFFDELDSVAVRREEEAHEESKRVVAQLLTSMDSMTSSLDVLVIAATNRPEAIDYALLRPGRFDWRIEFRLPDASDRQQILKRAGASVRTAGVLPLSLISALAHGWSAAELALVWSEAALLAAVEDRRAVTAEDLLGGYERVAARPRQSDREQGA